MVVWEIVFNQETASVHVRSAVVAKKYYTSFSILNELFWKSKSRVSQLFQMFEGLGCKKLPFIRGKQASIC